MGTLVESKITNPINMKACIVLIVLAVAVQAQKFEPAKCDYSKEMMCSGTWNEDWTEQITADFCIPMQNGDCWNYCPTQCCKDSIMCPGKMDPKGCKEPDFCHHGKFCPVNCDWEKEMMCPGPWDPKTGEQTGPDMCIPHKNGECAAHCPQTCMDGDMMCPGKTHADGCTDADYCVPGKFCPADCDWSKEMMCPGTWNEEWTEQITADYCMPMQNGDCYNFCPMTCGKDMVNCPGGMDPKGCPMPDACYPAKDGCPKI